MARILVMGAGGYIGIPLCEALEERGHFVQAVDRFYFGKYPRLRDAAPLHADIRTYEFPEGMFDVVIDLAGLSNDATAEINPKATRSINLEGAMRLAELAKRNGVRKYLYSSSCSVYGAGVKDRLSETDECKPLTLYASCKLQVEDRLRKLQSESFQPTILRNATVFGLAPRMRFDLAVNIMTARAWQEKVIYIMGGGEQVRPFVHINDVVTAFILAVGDDGAGGTFNVGSDRMNMSIGDLAKLVHEYFPDAVTHMIPDDADRRSYNVSFSSIRDRFGFISTKDVDAGIDEIKRALDNDRLKPPRDYPTSLTLQWYKNLIEWGHRIDRLRVDGPIP